jgi:iron(III) transport system permease protein
MRRIIIPLLVRGIVSAWILMASMFVRELTLSVVLSRPGTEVLAVQILRFADRIEARAARHGWRACGFADDGLWGRLSALGIIMIFISTTLVVLATLIGGKLRAVEA